MHANLVSLVLQYMYMHRGISTFGAFINHRRACAARVTVLCLFVSVSDTTLQASVEKGTRKFRHQRSVNDTLQCFDSWILQTMLGSRDMAKFVSQEAYDRASLPETSVHVINHMLLLFVIEHVLFYQSSSRFFRW